MTVGPAAGLVTGLLIGASLPLVLITAVSWVVALQVTLDGELQVGGTAGVRILPSAVLAFAAVGAVVALTGWGGTAMVDALATVVASAAVVGCSRVAIDRSRPALRVALVGSVDQVRAADAEWRMRDDLHVVGALTLACTSGDQRQGHDQTQADDVRHQVRSMRADTVVVLPGLDPGTIESLSWALESTSASMAMRASFDTIAPHRVDLARVGSTSFTRIRPSTPGLATTLVKSVMDRSLAAFLLLLLLPVLVVLAAAVRLGSPGPALFRQVRVGRNGRTFTMLKFRTMVVDAEEGKAQLADVDQGNGVLFKIKDDPRITRVGRLLRSTSVDELPQLVNILRGEMSLVGPRPALPNEVELYDARARRRLDVTPGLTGLWQVSGRSTLGWDESVRLDILYADNITVRGDLAICLRTVHAVLTRRGAY